MMSWVLNMQTKYTQRCADRGGGEGGGRGAPPFPPRDVSENLSWCICGEYVGTHEIWCNNLTQQFIHVNRIMILTPMMIDFFPCKLGKNSPREPLGFLNKVVLVPFEKTHLETFGYQSLTYFLVAIGSCPVQQGRAFEQIYDAFSAPGTGNIWGMNGFAVLKRIKK